MGGRGRGPHQARRGGREEHAPDSGAGAQALTHRGLGRRHAPDVRDANYPLRALLPAGEPPRHYRYWWDGGWRGDQGYTPQCVAYAWLHWLEDGPITCAPRAPGEGPVIQPEPFYKEAQRNDEWAGEDYPGTSVRAGARVLQRLGYIGEYRWDFTLSGLTEAVQHLGPVVVGTYWYDGMSRPDGEGVIRIGGRVAGGHAYVINGVNTRRAMFRLKNSWGISWALNGRAWIPFEDMERLIHAAGEVCIATEVQT